MLNVVSEFTINCYHRVLVFFSINSFQFVCSCVVVREANIAGLIFESEFFPLTKFSDQERLLQLVLAR